MVSSPAAVGFTGATFQPAKVLPDVTLTDTSGAPYNLFKEHTGKITVTYFGYTNCPDACPDDMAALGKAVEQLTPDQQRQVQVVFVTVDPSRDTAPVIRAWLDRFDKHIPAFVGLTGSAAQITKAAHQLGLPFTVSSASSGLEKVEHSTQMTAFDRTGTSNLAWLDKTAPSGIAHDLRLLLDNVTPI
ncbi:MAG: SCO family protein [Actinomycetes bacterium]